MPEGLVVLERDECRNLSRLWTLADLEAREASLAPVLAELRRLRDTQEDVADSEGVREGAAGAPPAAKVAGAVTLGSGA